MYEWSFDESGDIILAIKNGLKVYQLKEIRSGDIIECEIAPRWDTKLEKKSIRKHLTPERQRKHNEKVAADKIRRKANANFGEDDLEVTLTYKGSQPSMEQELPATSETVQKETRLTGPQVHLRHRGSDKRGNTFQGTPSPFTSRRHEPR